MSSDTRIATRDQPSNVPVRKLLMEFNASSAKIVFFTFGRDWREAIGFVKQTLRCRTGFAEVLLLAGTSASSKRGLCFESFGAC